MARLDQISLKQEYDDLEIDYAFENEKLYWFLNEKKKIK